MSDRQRDHFADGLKVAAEQGQQLTASRGISLEGTVKETERESSMENGE